TCRAGRYGWIAASCLGQALVEGGNDMTSRIAGVGLVLLLSTLSVRAATGDDFPFLEATVAQLQAEMASGRLTSERLTRAYIRRIRDLDSSDQGVNSIMELNPDAVAMARRADELRRHGVVLGPL